MKATDGRHDYSGSCAPNAEKYFRNETFSVGIFQWVPRASGIGLKKGGVIVRVSGLSDKPEAVYRLARTICDHLDAGTYDGPKNLTVDSPWAKSNATEES